MSASLPTKSKNSLFPPDGNSLSHTENLPLTSTEVEGSASESSCVKKQQKLSVWPRFTDADISLEKWDAVGKARDKGKGAVFEDCDNLITILPPTLAAVTVTWKRPVDYLLEESPVVVEKGCESINLVSHNVHLLTSEVMRWVICQIDLLWQLHNNRGIPGKINGSWKPWHHIYPRSKDYNQGPAYNPSGKYVVKLFWMGEWRKIVVDDRMPFNKHNQMLLPVSKPSEIWLSLLTKGILKILSLCSYREEYTSEYDFSNSSVVHMLTSWVPETIPIRSGHKDPMWMTMKKVLPEWNPNQPTEASSDEDTMVNEASNNGKDESPVVLFASYNVRPSYTKSCSPVVKQDSATGGLSSLGLCPDLSHMVLVTQTRRQSLRQPRPPHPSTLQNKFAYQGFKSRRVREVEAKKIAEELRLANFKIVEVISPLLNLHTAMSPDDFDSLKSHANNPSLFQKVKLTSECQVDLMESTGMSKWIEYDNFVNCFTTLHVMHKPAGYKYKEAVQDMKMINLKDSGHAKKNRLAPPGKKQIDTSHLHPLACDVGPSGTISNLLCVDSIKDIELVITVSTMTFWPYKVGQKNKSKPEMPESQLEGETQKANESALLIAEEYRWDSVVAGQPLLKVTTKGCKAGALCLSAGRHLIRLNMTAPICFHLEIWSNIEFSFQKEDEVFKELTKESLRYRHHAMVVLTTVAKLIALFDDIPSYREAFYGQGVGHRGRLITAHHCTVLYASIVDTLTLCLGTLLTNDLAFAWKAFIQEGLRVFLQGLEKDVPKRASEVDRLKFKDLNFGKKRQKAEEPESWIDRIPTTEEQQAAIKIQACYRGYWQHKIWLTVTQDSPQHKKACKLLEECLEVVIKNAELTALTLFQTMFKKDPQLLIKFPFKDDEWSRVCFKDHTGNYKEQQPNSIFLMFRETFYARRGVLVVPHLYTSVSTACLRVFNNDTGEEIPRVFKQVTPHVYLRNKQGYTFVAEGRAWNEPVLEGTCRLRLMGSEETLLRPKHQEIANCEFCSKEVQEYYLPTKDYEFVRHAVKVAEDMVVTIRLRTSKQSAYFKLQILDTINGYDQELISVSGRGHAVIPAFTFLKDGVRCESAMSYFFEDSPSPETVPEDENIVDDITNKEAENEDGNKPDNDEVQNETENRAENGTQQNEAKDEAENNEDAAANKDYSETRSCAEGLSNRMSAQGQAEPREIGLFDILDENDEDTFNMEVKEDCLDIKEVKQGDHSGNNNIEPEDDEAKCSGPVEEGLENLEHGYGQFERHKYIIRAVIEWNSWSESESGWDHYSIEKAKESQVANQDLPVKVLSSTVRDMAPSVTGRKTATRRSSSAFGKKTPTWKKAKGPLNPAIGKFDTSVAHWTMELVMAEDQQTFLDITKDNERDNQIQSIKSGWEAANPGRAVLANCLRRAYLDIHGSTSVRQNNGIPSSVLCPVVVDEGNDSTKPTEQKEIAISEIKKSHQTRRISSDKQRPRRKSSRLGLFSPLTVPQRKSTPQRISTPQLKPTFQDLSPFHTRQQIIQTDFSQFIKSCPKEVKPRLLDETEKLKRSANYEKEAQEFSSFRNMVYEERQKEKERRKEAKRIQLDLGEKRQREINEVRTRLNKMRESYHLKYLEEQQKRELAMFGPDSESGSSQQELDSTPTVQKGKAL